MNELHDLETYEVSLVPKGANGKNFLVFKNFKGKQGMMDAKKILDWVRSNPKKLKEVEKVIKSLEEDSHLEGGEAPLSDQHKAGLQAIARIAGPMKDHVKPEHMMKVLQSAGYDMSKAMAPKEPSVGGSEHEEEQEEPMAKGQMAIPEEVLSDMKDVLKEKMMKGEPLEKFDDSDDDEDDDWEDEDGDEMDKCIKSHVKQASGEAVKAYKAQMEKLGYRKYPDAEVSMKGIHKDLKQVDASDENKEHGEAQSMDKSIMKSLDLSKVDPKVKTALEAVFKSQEVAVQKAARLEGELKTEREARRDKEFIEKAAKLEVGAKTEDVAQILKSLADKDPKLADQMEAILKGAAEQIKKGNLFAETGSERGGSLPGNDAYAKLEAIADGLVQKSAEKISKAEAMDVVLKTVEGKRLYDEYMSSKPGMKV